MSKMSQLHVTLNEQAYRLGYSSVENAMADGYVVDYENETLVDGREQAHNAWLKERKEVLDDLKHLKNIYKEVKPDEDIIGRTIDFIKKGEI